MCLCCRNADNSHPESSDTTITRHGEVLKIWSDYENRRMEDYLNKYPQARKHHSNDKPGKIQVTPMLIGPLTIGQVEYKLDKITGRPHEKNVQKKPFNYKDDNWNEVLNKYQDGDEFYYFKDDAREFIPFSGMFEGFILIRDKEFLGIIGTAALIQ